MSFSGSAELHLDCQTGAINLEIVSPDEDDLFADYDISVKREGCWCRNKETP